MIFPDQEILHSQEGGRARGGGGRGSRSNSNSSSLAIPTNMGKCPRYILRWEKSKSQNRTFSVPPSVHKQVACATYYVYVYT